MVHTCVHPSRWSTQVKCWYFIHLIYAPITDVCPICIKSRGIVISPSMYTYVCSVGKCLEETCFGMFVRDEPYNRSVIWNVRNPMHNVIFVYYAGRIQGQLRRWESCTYCNDISVVPTQLAREYKLPLRVMVRVRRCVDIVVWVRLRVSGTLCIRYTSCGDAFLLDTTT